MTLRLVMMGTGDFALPTFLSLYESPHDVVGLFTQPDRRGRGHHHHRNVMKEAALERGTPVFQPERANAQEGLEALRSISPDLAVVAAYGQILSPALLEIPTHGAINVHASLLPKYRGAAPVQYTILGGETETGVSVFQIEPRLDAGPLLGTVTTPVEPKETAGELERRLADLAVPLVRRIIDEIEAGTTRPLPQNSTQATRAPRLNKASGLIDWSQPAEQIERQVRAMQPWPKAFTFLEQPDAEPLRLIILEAEPRPEERNEAPGKVILAGSKRLIIQTGQGQLEIHRLQPAGKRAMSTEEFLRGHRVAEGQRLGASRGGWAS